MKELAVIILNYNSSVEVIKQITFLTINDQIFKDSFIILDNNSSDGSLLEKYCNQYGFFFKQMNSNLGYAHANNWAIRKAVEMRKKFFLILNPDVKIDYNTVQKLFNNLIIDPYLAVVGPRMLYENSSKIIFSDGGLLFPKKGFQGAHYNFLQNTDEQVSFGFNYNIDYVTGSCMMFRREVLDDIGFMNEDLFMYYEESEWCYNIKKSNRWKIAIDTSCIALQSDSSRGKTYEFYMTRNRIWMTKKHQGNLLFVIRERLIVARKRFFSRKGIFIENAQFSSNILKGIVHGLLGKLGKI